MPKVVREKVMNVSPEALFKAITTFSDYKDFLPEVVLSEVTAGAGTTKPTVRFEIEVIKRFHYTLRFDSSDPLNISWKLEESSIFKKNDGCWRLKREGDLTHVAYELDVDFSFFVPAWVSKKLTEVNLPKLLESFEKQAQKYL